MMQNRKQQMQSNSTRKNSQVSTGLVCNSKKYKVNLKIATAIIAVASLLFVAVGCEFQNQQGQESSVSHDAKIIIDGWQQKQDYACDKTDRLIAHGGSSIEGYSTTNSLEALLQAIDNGYTLIELDMNFSADQEVIMIHDFDVTLNYYFGGQITGEIGKAAFEEKLVHGKYHTLTLDRLIEVMKKSEGYRIVTDVKENNVAVLTKISEKYPDYLDRFVPQIYNTDEFDAVKELGYEDIILTTYQMMEPDFDDIYGCYKDKGLMAITISEDYFAKDIIDRLLANNVKVYRHPINNFELMQNLFELGNYGVYTGNLLPEEITGDKSRMYITVTNDEGNLVKLTDYKVQSETVEDIVAQNVHGLEELEYRIYYVGEERLNKQMLSDLPYGKLPMTVEIWKCDENYNNGEYQGITLKYWFWKDDSGVRILDEKYEYRADNRRVIPTMADTLAKWDKAPDDNSIQSIESIKNLITETEEMNYNDILMRSFIAHAGDYYYYNNGLSGAYMQDDEFLYVIEVKDVNNDESGEKLISSVYVPLYETGMELGAEKIYMDGQRSVHLEYQGAEYIMGQGSTELTIKGLETEKVTLQEPMMPVLKKNFVTISYITYVFDRACIVREHILIVLPKDINISDLSEKEINEFVDRAKALYHM